MSSWGKTFREMVSIAIIGFAAKIFKVDLLLSIAYDLTYMRIDKDN